VLAPGVPRPHDGTVAVLETDVPAMRDKIVLPVTHTQMLLSKSVMREIASFLRDGKFSHTDARKAADSNSSYRSSRFPKTRPAAHQDESAGSG
jgi:hypothetical protein